MSMECGAACREAREAWAGGRFEESYAILRPDQTLTSVYDRAEENMAVVCSTVQGFIEIDCALSVSVAVQVHGSKL